MPGRREIIPGFVASKFRRPLCPALFERLFRLVAAGISAALLAWALVFATAAVAQTPAPQAPAVAQTPVPQAPDVSPTPEVAPAPAADAGVHPVRREILALYDSRDDARADQSRIHRFAEMPLNYLGYVVTYWDLRAGLPPAERTANLHGAITWLRRSQRSAFYLWARDLVTRGVRVVVLGDGGLVFGETAPNDANQLFEAIGFRMSGGFVDLTYDAKVLYRDTLVGYEQKLDPVLPAFPIVGTLTSDLASHLVLEQHDAASTLTSSVVLTGKRGGFAASGYILYEEPITSRVRWLIDPFAFFASAFGDGTRPLPDVTTLSGRRIYFSHIDGDGWNNISRIEAYHDQQKISAEVILREAVAPYPDLPVSIGVIGADVDDRYGPTGAARRVTREFYKLPQVEVATHSYTHPYQWMFFEHYDREVEERLIGADDGNDWTSALGERVGRLVKRFFPKAGRKPHVDAKLDDNTKQVDDDPPRAFSEFPFDFKQETQGAIRASERLAPAGKRTALYLWSGGAEPFEAMIAETRRLGVRNMNGGDSRVDADYPSIAYLSPIGRPVGAERQIYAGNANDYIYISDGQGRDTGYLNLETTVTASEDPLRLKPFNVYYHMFAGERAAQLAAVRHHLDIARQAPLAPITAAHYAAIADGFYATEITQLDGMSWLIRNRGALGTMRFDEAADLTVDYTRSVGVLGQNRKGTSLYVALDEAQDDVLLVLVPTAGAQTSVAAPRLIEGRWVFRDLRRRDCGFSVMAKGFGAGQMRWGGLKPGLYHVTVSDSGKVVWTAASEVGEDGRLAVTADADATRPLDIDVTCAGMEDAG